MFRRRGRPAHPDVLTPAEWRVVEGIRAGQTNAEIAGTLGISVNTVRYHVSNALSKTGLSDRTELALWRREPRRLALGFPAPLGLLLGGSAATVAVLAIAWVVANEWTAGEIDARTFVGFDTRISSDEYVRYDGDYLEQSGLIDAGVLLENDSDELFEVMYRPGWFGVRTSGLAWAGGRVSLPDEPQQYLEAWVPGTAGQGWSASFTAGLTREVDGVRLYARVSIMDRGDDGLNERLVQRGGPGVIAFLPYEDITVVRVALTDNDGHVYPSVLDETGRIWVALDQRIRDDEVVALDSGEALSLAGMRSVGDLYGGVPHYEGYTRASVRCSDGEACHTVAAVATGALHAVADGLLECGHASDVTGTMGMRVLFLTTDDFRLQIRPLSSSSLRDEHCMDLPRMVRLGEPLPALGSYWGLSAWTLEGEPLDVAMSFDRTLYIGEANVKVICPPCRPVW